MKIWEMVKKTNLSIEVTLFSSEEILRLHIKNNLSNDCVLSLTELDEMGEGFFYRGPDIDPMEFLGEKK